MKNKILIVIICIFHFFCCLIKAQSPFLINNTLIYEIGNEWIYEYEYQAHNNKNLENIRLINEESKKIDKIIMKVVKYDVKLADEYDVSKNIILQNSYPPKLVQDGACIIENNEKVWIHPPRHYFFKILELNPFPEILKPYTIGKEWDWSLIIGQQHGDVRWKEWEENITNKSYYKIIGDTILETKIGKLHCYIVNSYAVSELGKTYLTSYFNEKYGFVKLDYTNIDGSKINLNLIQYNNGSGKVDFFRVRVN